MSNSFEIKTDIANSIIDLRSVPTILDNLVDAFALQYIELTPEQESKLLEDYTQISDVLLLANRIIGRTLEELDEITNKKYDSLESTVTTETTKIQK